MSTRVSKLPYKLKHMSTRRKKEKERKKEQRKEERKKEKKKETKKGKQEKQKRKQKKERTWIKTSRFQEARFSVTTAFVGRTDAGAQSIVSVFGWWDARCWVSPEY